MIQYRTIEDYLTTLLSEKGISLDHVFEIKSDTLFGNHYVPMEVVIEFIGSLSKHTQNEIREVLVKIDFNNGNILHFIEYITKGMVQINFPQN